jgi:hypothetical protein
MYTVEILPNIIQALLPVIIKIFIKILVGLRRYLNAVMIWSNTVSTGSTCSTAALREEHTPHYGNRTHYGMT